MIHKNHDNEQIKEENAVKNSTTIDKIIASAYKHFASSQHKQKLIDITTQLSCKAQQISFRNSGEFQVIVEYNCVSMETIFIAVKQTASIQSIMNEYKQKKLVGEANAFLYHISNSDNKLSRIRNAIGIYKTWRESNYSCIYTLNV